jgi:hypothetical protein
MEKSLAFDCKYAEGVKKRTHRRLLYETLVSGLHLQTKGNLASGTEREKQPSMYTGTIV